MITQIKPVFKHRNINGFLRQRSEWSEKVASEIAEKEGITLTPKHWDIIHFVRTEFYSNGGNVPMEREIRRGMEREWKVSLTGADMSALFPGGANTQAAKIAGCITVRTVEDLLGVKGDVVWSIHPDQVVIDALKILSEKNIGALMVVENDELVGVVSERDYTREVVLRDRSTTDTTIREIMSGDVVSVEPSDTLDQCMALMTERGFRHLPVLHKGRLAGVLSMPDLVKVIVEQQQFTISKLREADSLEKVS